MTITMTKRHTKKDYYSVDKILDIIANYHRNYLRLKEMEETQNEYQSAGVAQYGVESSLPKGNGISKVVEREAIRRVDSLKYWSQIKTDMEYIFDRLYRVTDEHDAMVLSLRLDGLSVKEIARFVHVDSSTVYRILRRVARQIKGDD